MRKNALKAKIKGHVETIRCLKAQKSRVKTSSWDGRVEEMNHLFFERQEERDHGRILHLAYGYRKGIPYATMERSTCGDHYQRKDLIKSVATWATTSEARIETWMKGEPEVQKSHKSARSLMAQMAH